MRGRPKTCQPVSKPCVVCGNPIVKPYQCELDAVRAHNGCKGQLYTQRAAFSRLETLEPHLAGFSVTERARFLEGYRLGTRHTYSRYAARTRRKVAA